MTRITHNSVFAAHRLEMPDSIQDRHPAFFFSRSAQLKNPAAALVKCSTGIMRRFIIRSVSPEEMHAMRCLRAAEGYLDLEMFQEAEEELRELDPTWFALDHTLSLQLRVFAGLSQSE